LRNTHGRRFGGDEIERRILVENPALELPQRQRRLDPERLHERAPRIAVRLQRICLPPRAVQREHQLGTQPLPQRVLADEQLELADQLGAPAEREIALDPLLQRLQPKPVEPLDLGLRPALVGELGQRRPSPEREGLPEQHVRLRGRGGPGLSHELLEAVQVQRGAIGTKLVRGGDRPDDAVAQLAAEPRDVRLEHLRGRGRRPAGPELLDQDVARDRLVGPEEQDREQGARLVSAQRDLAALGDHLERPEETELHASIVPEPRTRHKDAASTRFRPRLDQRSTAVEHPRRIDERHPEEDLA
jgi:hypothetical protein